MLRIAEGWNPNVPVLDFDDVDPSNVKEEVDRLQSEHQLGDADLYRSSENNFHIYFFYDNGRDRDEIIEVIEDAELVDPEFKEFQRDRDETRMRVKGKHKKEIEYVGRIESDYDGKGINQKAEHLKRMFHRMKK